MDLKTMMMMIGGSGRSFLTSFIYSGEFVLMPVSCRRYLYLSSFFLIIKISLSLNLKFLLCLLAFMISNLDFLHTNLHTATSLPSLRSVLYWSVLRTGEELKILTRVSSIGKVRLGNTTSKEQSYCSFKLIYA